MVKKNKNSIIKIEFENYFTFISNVMQWDFKYILYSKDDVETHLLTLYMYMKNERIYFTKIAIIP